MPASARKSRTSVRHPSNGPVNPGRSTWQLQTAKARFSEVFRPARTVGPQFITRQGEETVLIVPAQKFHRFAGPSRQAETLVQFFRESPLVELEKLTEPPLS